MNRIIKFFPIIFLIVLLFLPVYIRSRLAPSSVLKSSVNLQYKLATGAEGGIYKPLGRGIATLINRELGSGAIEPVETAGSVDNLRRLKKSADFAILEGDIAKMAYKGEVGLPAMPDLRGIMVLYKECLQVYVGYNSDIHQFKDIENRVVAIGEYGSAMSLNFQTICEAANISIEKIDKRYLAFPQALEQLKLANDLYRKFDEIQKEIDTEKVAQTQNLSKIKDLQSERDEIKRRIKTHVEVVFFFGGTKLRAVEKYGLHLRLLPVPAEIAARLRQKNLPYSPLKMTNADFSFLQHDVETIGTSAILACKKDAPPALVAQIRKIILANTKQLELSHPIARNIKFVDQSLMPIPLHRGVNLITKDRVEFFFFAILLVVAVLLLSFITTMRIVWPGSFTRFKRVLFKVGQGKGYVTVLFIILIAFCVLIFAGAAFISNAEKQADSTYYADYSSSFITMIKALSLGFEKRYMPQTFSAKAIVIATFIAYVLLLVWLFTNLLAIFLRQEQQAASKPIIKKLTKELAEFDSNITETKESPH